MNPDKKIKVLVIDDSEVTHTFLKSFLEEYNFVVYTCNDGLEGIQKSAELKPDLIFLDLMMPNLDGIKMLQVKNVLKDIKDIPVIVISGNTARRNVLAATEAGANGVISKPLKNDVIIKNVNEVLGYDAFKGYRPDKISMNESNEMKANLLQIFFDLFPQKKQALQQAIRSKNIQKVHEVAHDLKGSGGTVGLPHISAICAEIEGKDVKSATDWVFIEFKCNELFQEIFKIIDQKNNR